MSDNMQKARVKLLLRHPFFATLLLSTPSRMSKEVPTAGTNGRELIWNPDFMATLDQDETQGVMCHEILHMALEHCLRLYGRNALLWNVATDYAINLIIEEAGLKLPKGGLLDKQYAGMSADEIYDKLMQQMQKGGKGASKIKQDAMHGDILSPGEMTEEERAQTERKVRQNVAQAANMARMAGKLTGGLERLVDQMLNPAVPWQVLLRDYMTRICKDDESWNRRNRRYAHAFLPARHSERMGEIVIIGDTSGSISEEDLNRVAAEVNAIAEQVRPELIRVIWADTVVTREETFEPGEEIRLKPAGGGGTDMRVPLHHVEMNYDPQVVVLVTDGYTPWPAVEPPYPLIVCCTTQEPVPVGLVVRI